MQAKTALAPFERVRILFQVQHQEYARFSGQPLLPISVVQMMFAR